MIGQTLALVRQRLGLTHIEMATRLGVASGSYAAYETQGRRPGNDALERLLELVREGAPDLEARVQERIAAIRATRPKQAPGAPGAQTTERARRLHRRNEAQAAERRRLLEIDSQNRKQQLRRELREKGNP